MMPMKKASSDMKSAARPRNETTRLSALATGLRLMTTADAEDQHQQRENPEQERGHQFRTRMEQMK